MVTGELKSKIDRVWEAFWTGGISNPLTVIEQMTYLLFIRRLDELQLAREARANRLGGGIQNPIYRPEQYPLRWSSFKNEAPEEMYNRFRREGGAFDFMRNFGADDPENAFARHMKGATFMIPTPRLLASVVDMLDQIPMDDRDTKGDVYEYLLSKIAAAGQNGQFRTPRHIIRMMVEMMQPRPDDIICDPSAGTCGFLVAAAESLRERHPEVEFDAQFRRGERLLGIEFDATMQRIGAMNLMLHGIESPRLTDVDALSKDNTDFDECCTLVLANPPFKGSLDESAVHPALHRMLPKAKKTELLFIALMLRGLRPGGRAAVIVPDGVLFGNSKNHLDLRRELLDRQRLEAVVSMPSGVFKPYAGVSTAVLIFTKTNSGGTDHVWFFDMQADGFTLDDKRNLTERNDIPEILRRWHHRSSPAETSRSRTEQSFVVPLAEIQANNYDLSINRYKEMVYQTTQHEPPAVLLQRIRALDTERAATMARLETLLAEL